MNVTEHNNITHIPGRFLYPHSVYERLVVQSELRDHMGAVHGQLRPPPLEVRVLVSQPGYIKTEACVLKDMHTNVYVFTK